MDKNILSLIEKKKYRQLGTGYISNAYEIEYNNNKYIILQGQISVSFKYYQFSYNNLIFLINNGNSYIKSVKIPCEELRLIQPSQKEDFFKNGAFMYKLIEGIVFYEKYFNKINIENITNSIAKFLIELYKIPVNKGGVERYKKDQINILTNNINNVKNYLNNINVEKLVSFQNEYLGYINKFEDFHYIHGDFWQENLIISNNYQNLIGVIDFDNFGIGDIARDYAALFNLGFNFINKIIEKTQEIIEDKDNFIKRINIYIKFIIIGCFSFLYINNKDSKNIEKQLKLLKKYDLI